MKRIITKMNDGGQIILEVILGIGVAAFFIIGAAALTATSLQSVTTASRKNQSALLAQSAMEEMKIVRDRDWYEFDATCTTGSPCHTELVSGNWDLSSGSETHSVGGITYTEKVILDSACRTTVGNIADCPSNVTDPASKKVTVIMEWTVGGLTSNTTLVQFMTQFTNLTKRQTDWSDGAHSDGSSASCDNWDNNTDDYCRKSGDISAGTAGEAKLI